jgi:hypothetical protein
MTPATGSILRRVGLLIEAISLFGLLSLARGQADVWARRGIDPSVLMAGGLALGFLLWLAGTLAIHWPGRKEGGPS